jgi:hypothetical protein
MSVNGEERDHRRGELLTASGETKVAVDTVRQQVAALASGGFLTEARNVVLLGPPGTD